MALNSVHRAFWALVRWQYGVITRQQLLDFKYSPEAIQHRIDLGRLRPVYDGVYAVGRPELCVRGEWMAAVLACGEGAAHCGESGAQVWEIRPQGPCRPSVAVPATRNPRRTEIDVSRRVGYAVTAHQRIPVLPPAEILVDLAMTLPLGPLERAINQADKLDLIDPETLRREIAGLSRRPGLAKLRRTLDLRTFTLTDSELERIFLPIARKAGLPRPLTQHRVSGFLVEFFFEGLGLVVETDGLRYHRTPAQQARDRLRDQAHVAAGMTVVHFTHAQVRYAPEHVVDTLRAVAERLAARR